MRALIILGAVMLCAHLIAGYDAKLLDTSTVSNRTFLRAMNNLGCAYYAEGQTKKARRCFDVILSLDDGKNPDLMRKARLNITRIGVPTLGSLVKR